MLVAFVIFTICGQVVEAGFFQDYPIPFATELSAYVIIGSVIAFFNYFDQYSGLQLACKTGNLQAVKKLVLTENYEINPYWYGQKTPFMLGCLSRNPELIDWLARYGADVNKEVCDEGTPLHCLSALGDFELVKLLLLRGANPAEREYLLDKKPREWALREGHAHVVRLLDAFEDGYTNYSKAPIAFVNKEFVTLENPDTFIILDSLHSNIFFSFCYYRCHETDEFAMISTQYVHQDKIDAFNRLVKDCNLDEDNYDKRRKILHTIQEKLAMYSMCKRTTTTNVTFSFID